MIVSLSVKNGISSVVLLNEDGVVVKSSVKRCDTSSHSYEQLINTFKRSILEVKPFVESGKADKVTFELNVRAIIKWIEESSPSKTFEKPFIEAMSMLSNLAVEYELQYVKTPIASKYKICDTKIEMSGLDSIMEV